MKLLTQVQHNVGGPLEGIGPYGTGGSTSPSRLTQVLTVAVGILTLIAGIWFIFLLISGGIEWMASGGDKGKLATARTRMFNGAVGLAIVVAALFIAEIFGGLVGLPDILNPGGIIENLGP
jgi:hypothetical protein